MTSFHLPEVSPSVLQDIPSPSLIVFADVVKSNIARMIDVAGDVDRLRPHCKTHKMPDVIKLLLANGVTRHKAATIAEVEMLATAGATDIVLAYNPVGPNIDRVVKLKQKFPTLQLTVTADHEKPLKQLSEAAQKASTTVGVLLDLNVGLQRTGVPADSQAAEELYAHLFELPGITAKGFHVYDGHQHQHSFQERSAAVADSWQAVLKLESDCEAAGRPVEEILCGGTPTFPVYAAMDHPKIRLSPGTSVFHDVGYGEAFPDLGFRPAAVVLTRVISRPTSDRITLDVGNKAIAADPTTQRAYFPAIPDGKQLLHNEEHLVLQTESANDYEPGDALLAVPIHVCPTSALHTAATVIEGGQVTESWPVTARDRCLSI